MKQARMEVSDKSKKMMDELLSTYEHKLMEYIAYLEKLYINGTLIMLDITDEIEAEHLEYAQRLGLGMETGEEVFNIYLDTHGIDEKNDVLYALLNSYGQKGHFNLKEIQEATSHMTEFWSNEYVRFAKAVEELLQLQTSLHEKSASTELSAMDQMELYEKAMEIGFYNKTSIMVAIRGNEIKLGYHKKQ